MGCCSSTEQQTSAAVNALFDSSGTLDLGSGRKILRIGAQANFSRLAEVSELSA
jgi:hypothetical protein